MCVKHIQYRSIQIYFATYALNSCNIVSKHMKHAFGTCRPSKKKETLHRWSRGEGWRADELTAGGARLARSPSDQREGTSRTIVDFLRCGARCLIVATPAAESRASGFASKRAFCPPPH